LSTKVRYLGVGEETTPGTPVAAAAYLPIISESIRPSQGWVFPETVEDRGAKRAILGRFGSVGDVRMNVIPLALTKLLKWAFGGLTTTSLGGTPAAYKHEFKPADVLKTFTARIGAEEAERVIAGCMINSLELAMAVADVICGVSIGVDGGEETKATIGTPTFPSGDGAKEFSFLAPAALTWGGTSKVAIVEALRARLINTIPDRWTAEGRFKKRAKVAKREVTADLDLLFPDTTEYDRFLAGTSMAIQFKAEGATISGTNKYTFQIDVPQCYYQEDTAPHIDRREELKLTAPVRAVVDPTAGYDIMATIINTESTI